MQEIKPVRSVKIPEYPLQNFVLAHPELLRKLPERWQKSRKALMAASMATSLVFSLAACSPAIKSDGKASDTPSSSPSASETASTTEFRTAGVPLPPETVDEADAFKLIANLTSGLLDGAQQNVQSRKNTTFVRFDAGSKVLQEVAFADVEKPMAIDLQSADKKIGFEYLKDERDANEAVDYAASGTEIRAEKSRSYVLVMDAAYKAEEEVNTQIKEQVEGFLAWLKAEGII